MNRSNTTAVHVVLPIQSNCSSKASHENAVRTLVTNDHSDANTTAIPVIVPIAKTIIATQTATQETDCVSSNHLLRRMPPRCVFVNPVSARESLPKPWYKTGKIREHDQGLNFAGALDNFSENLSARGEYTRMEEAVHRNCDQLEDVMSVEHDMTDICLHVGKLVITDRIGGFLRPDAVKIIEWVLSQGQKHSSGNSTPVSSKSFSAPIESFCNPCSLLPLMDFCAPVHKYRHYTGASTDFPSWEEWQILCQQYFLAVDPLAHVLSRDSFQARVAQSYRSIYCGYHIPASTKALVLAVCFTATLSLHSLQCQRDLGASKADLVERFKTAAEAQLQKAKVLSTSDLETTQAAVIYMLPISSEGISRSCSVFIRALIRNAQLAGLDDQNERAGSSPLETQMRKHLWCQLAFLDLRTTEAQGSRPMIPSFENDALPWNMDDHLLAQSPLQDSEGHWTDSTFSLIRYECYGVHRVILRAKEDIKQGRTSLPIVAASIAAKRERIDNIYLKRLDEKVAVQRCAKLVGRLLMARLDCMLFQDEIPPTRRSEDDIRLRDRLVLSSLVVMESAAALETEPGLAPWSWNFLAYQQYHSILFLLQEIHQTPGLEHAERINSILNHVFGHSVGFSPWQRSNEILRLIHQQLKNFLAARGTLGEQSPTSSLAHENKNGAEITPVEDVFQASIEDPEFWHEWDAKIALPFSPFDNMG